MDIYGLAYQPFPANALHITLRDWHGDCGIRRQSKKKGFEMSIHMNQLSDGKSLYVTVTGKLEEADYERFVPEVERLIESHEKISLVVEFKDFTGWTSGALWEDIKFDVKHFNDIERLAMIGEKHWHEWMAKFCKPFTTAKIRYFSPENKAEAVDWVQEKASAAAHRE